MLTTSSGKISRLQFEMCKAMIVISKSALAIYHFQKVVATFQSAQATLPKGSQRKLGTKRNSFAQPIGQVCVCHQRRNFGEITWEQNVFIRVPLFCVRASALFHFKNMCTVPFQEDSSKRECRVILLYNSSQCRHNRLNARICLHFTVSMLITLLIHFSLKERKTLVISVVSYREGSRLRDGSNSLKSSSGSASYQALTLATGCAEPLIFFDLLVSDSGIYSHCCVLSTVTQSVTLL